MLDDMVDTPTVLYIVVVDLDDEDKISSPSLLTPSPSSSFKYTRSALRSALQLMGCKARPAFKISRRVFEIMRIESSTSASHILTSSRSEASISNTPGIESSESNGCLDHHHHHHQNHHERPLNFTTLPKNNSIWFDQYKRPTTVFIPRENFLNVVCQTLAQYKYVGPKQREDVALACRIRERKESVTVLLCGTSGCGKSTLSSLLGCRLGVTTVVSTDSIRHMMRSFDDENQNDLLWSSTYHAGEHLDPVAMAKAKSRRKAKKLSRESAYSTTVNLEKKAPETGLNGELIGEKQMAIEGFKAQSEMVIENLDRLITAWEDRKESVVVEGVHLSLNFVMGLMRKHPSIIPFMVYISNEDKHMERFAVRAKYMTLDPSKNKYVKYIRNIRAIQEYLCNRADKHLVPKVNNTNVDKSVAAIHATVFSCLRRRELGEYLYDPTTNTVPLIDEEYRNQRAANSLSSKGMFQLIQRKGSSRHLMALVNTDGSVAKAWPVGSGSFELSHNSFDSNVVGSPLYGPLQIGKSEPVNLPFGSFGISAWPSDTCGTSYSGSFDESRADGSAIGSRHYSSRCSSPAISSDGPSKEVKEESSVADSEEDTDDSKDTSDIDDDNKEIHEEMEGSVDDESTQSDEEYGDLENGYCCCNPEEPSSYPTKNDPKEFKYQQNLDIFLRTSGLLFLEFKYPTKARIRRRSFGDFSQFNGPATMMGNH